MVGCTKFCWQGSIGLCGWLRVCVCVCARDVDYYGYFSEWVSYCVCMCVWVLNKMEKEWVSWCGSLHESRWQKLSTSRIALSRDWTWLARVNSEKKYSSLARQSAVCPWGDLVRSSCSTCINTKTQCGQTLHTAGDIGKQCVVENEVDTALRLEFAVKSWCTICIQKGRHCHLTNCGWGRQHIISGGGSIHHKACGALEDWPPLCGG